MLRKAGFDRYRCDAQISIELTTACNGGADTWSFQAIDLGYAGAQLTSYVREELHKCTGQATIIQGAVSQFGGNAFEEGQKVGACLELKSEAQKLGCAIN